MYYYIHVDVHIPAEIICQNLTFHWGRNSSNLFYILFFAYSFSDLITMFLCGSRLINISLRKSSHGIKHVPARTDSLTRHKVIEL